MNNLIIGTAGHVDHGKTSLILALTGIDADRLKEEKARGITIELGFAYLTLPNGERCGIIDVPGHEKFIRNMLAGAGSVDIALFVIAADEGIMPQSREHLEILSLLGITRGIVAVTKTDIVEKEWLEMVIMDIQEELRGSFLENAQIIPLSTKTEQGLPELKEALATMIEESKANYRDNAPFRLLVDRVFTKDGFGTVVTGTLTDGSLSVGDDITLYPSSTPTKIRNIQVHSRAVQTAYRGQRVAANLSGLKVSDIHKGCVLAMTGSIKNSDILDVKIDIVKSTNRKILDNSRLHLHYGTDETTCKLVLFGRDELVAGESCYAQLRTEVPISTRAGDRFVLRFYSPMETIGGGIILDANPPKRSKREKGVIDLCRIKESGSLLERISCFILDRSKSFPLVKELKTNPFLLDPQFDVELERLVSIKEVYLVKDSVIHKDYLSILTEKCRQILLDFHKNNPLLEGIKKEQLRSSLFQRLFSQYFDDCLAIMEKNGEIRIEGGLVSDASFKLSMSHAQKKLYDEIEGIVLSAEFSTPSLDELSARYPREQKTFKNTLDSLIAKGRIVVLSSQIIMHRQICDKALEYIRTLNKEFSLAEFRDGVGTSRKYAVALLEYFDNKGITKKIGDFRTLNSKFS